MDLDVQPKFLPVGFNDVHIGSVDGSDAARGRLCVGHDLVRDEHGLFRGGGEASLAGKLRQQIPAAIMSSGV